MSPSDPTSRSAAPPPGGVGVLRGVGDAVTEADAALIGMLGFERQDLETPRWDWRLVTPYEFQQADAAALAEVSRRGFAAPYEKALLRKDGSRVPVVVMVTRDDDRPEAWVQHIVRLPEAESDVARRADDALRASESLFRVLATASPLGVFLTNKHGECTYANPRIAAIWNLTPEEMLGRGFVRYTHPDDVERTRAKFFSALASETRLDVQYRLLLPDGRVRHVRMWIAPMHEGGEFKGFVGSVEDDTERLLLERRVQQNDKMQSLGTLAGGIAHDFNNMLAVVLGHTELAADEARGEERLLERLDEIRTASLRARDLVRQILTFSRRSEHRESPLDLREVVSETMRLMRSTFPASVALESLLPEQPLIVLGDATALQQIVVNLCSNAEYALRAKGGGRIFVRLDGPAPGDGGEALLVVRDDGPGMSAEVRERAFEPFFTTKPLGEGTGMGLAVVHGIVAAMRGSIAIESAPGSGTEVRVTLPLVRAALAAESPRAESGKGGGHVLLVEDEPAVLQVVTRILELAGFRVTACARAAEGLEAFRSTPLGFDLLLSDIAMPELTGDQLAQCVHEIRPELPVILMTGFSHFLTPESARALGIAALLQKPLTARDLVQAVRGALPPAAAGAGST